MQRLSFVFMLTIVLGLSHVSLASPITYNPDLTADCTWRVGSISQPNANQSNPVGAEYFKFWGETGTLYCVTGQRLDNAYDMDFWIFEGQFADTSAFAGGSSSGFDSSDPGFIDFADDELPPPGPGPYGDPYSEFTAATTGWYTIAVTNFFSDGDPPYDFRLKVCADCPEPSTFLLVLSAGLGLVAVRRWKVS